jgi:predicted DNA-binding protein
VSIEQGEIMQNIILEGVQVSKKLSAPMSTRVPIEVQELVDELAGGARAKWIREAIELKLEVELGQSSIAELKKSTNTMNSNEYINFFKSIFSVFLANKKPDVAGRAFRVH